MYYLSTQFAVTDLSHKYELYLTLFVCLVDSMSSTLDAAKMFAPAAAAAKTTTYKDKVYKCAWDKAQQYVDQQELPALWDRTQLLGSRDNLDRDEVS